MKIPWFLILLIFMGCKSEFIKQIDVQGHRGCRALMPENSMPAFKKALEIGVNTLEMDVVISKDHKVLVSHEPFMNHEITLGISGNAILAENETSYNLYKMVYDSIILYDCGSKPHPRFPNQRKIKVHKPLLSEVITLAENKSNNTIRYNIEIKSDPAYDNVFTPEVSEFVKLVIEVIASKDIVARTSLQSFDVRALEVIHSQNPEFSTVLLVDENEMIATKLSKLTFKPDIISPYYKLLDAKMVKLYQNRGFEIIPWTVNSKNDIVQMLNLNVDGIISDHPDLVIKVLNGSK